MPKGGQGPSREARLETLASAGSGQSLAAYQCTSRIAGAIPNVSAIHHASVAICPSGQNPTLANHTNNPSCLFLGTHPGSTTFQVEPQRTGLACIPSLAPTNVVM